MVLCEMMMILVQYGRKILLKYLFIFIKNSKRFFEYLKDINPAITGKVIGYRLFGHPILKYPFAIFTGVV
jgi:hypothetical protein